MAKSKLYRIYTRLLSNIYPSTTTDNSYQFPCMKFNHKFDNNNGTNIIVNVSSNKRGLYRQIQ